MLFTYMAICVYCIYRKKSLLGFCVSDVVTVAARLYVCRVETFFCVSTPSEI